MGLFGRNSKKSDSGDVRSDDGGKVCPKCGSGLDDKAKFCPYCGQRVETFFCGKCGAAVPVNSKFCPGCGSNVKKSKAIIDPGNSRDEFSRKREWRRNPEDFARRFEVDELRGILKKTVTVTEGTRAMLFQGGAFVGDLTPGHYSLGNILETKLPVNLDDRATVVLIDDGIISIDFSFDNTQVRTADSVPVGVSGKLTVKNVNSKSFIDNYLKGKNQVLLSDLEDELKHDILAVVQSAFYSYKMDDLHGNLKIKDEIEQKTLMQVSPTLISYGFSIEHLRFVNCDEAEWSEIIGKKGSGTKLITGKTVDVDIEQKLREILSDDKMHRLQNDDDVEAFVHELVIGGLIRKNELEELKIKISHRRDDAEFIRAIVREKAIQAHGHDLSNAELSNKMGQEFSYNEHGIRMDDSQKEHEDKWAGREHERDMREMDSLLNMKMKMTEAKLQRETGEQQILHRDLDKEAEIEGVKLSHRTNASAEALITMAGRDAAEQITELEKMKRAASLSAEQIVALSARDSVAAAEAIKQKFGSEEMEKMHAARLEDQQRYMAMVQATFGENSDRMVDVMNQALGAMGSTATARSSAQQAQGSTVVTGGGGFGGQPVIINPVQQNTQPDSGGSENDTQGKAVPEGVNPEGVKECPACGAELSSSAAFCTDCGEKL
ncbi:zinc-ribbon domain-containing protein [Methanoplanus endosymbiosus]|uniref:Zinc-ribbon domain-containing protein n=1 Tax=Methanoplanus endosymbiosus TaxID=33865 RepID=A0A9E7TMV5_9EURY|nr:zinc-ribbon domain-containing protein [Methanoplanus endosymbiosus]UUX93736.1 zinc-ribbon domain-containing protein [Methanoplanus endosymbiosus]